MASLFMMSLTSHNWIDKLQLAPHPEGGYYREIYRAEGIISQPNLPMRYSGGRSFSTAIYYLLESKDVSSLHRLRSDEQWFHIDGSALTIHTFAPDGAYRPFHIGKNLEQGEMPYGVVHHGYWFGGTVNEPNSFTLVGCVVAPGFDFEDFELAQRDELLQQFPLQKSIIERLTRR